MIGKSELGPGGPVQVVDVFVDPSCPWAWNAARWLKAVAPERDLSLRWRSFCLEIRDEGALPPTMPEPLRLVAPQLRAAAHRALRVFEALRADGADDAIDRLYMAWGQRLFGRAQPAAPAPGLLDECLQKCGLDPTLAQAAGNVAWDAAIVRSMKEAYAIGGDKTHTPVVALAGDPPRGFKGPVIARPPTGEAAVRLWDAFVVLAEDPEVFELTRPRRAPGP